MEILVINFDTVLYNCIRLYEDRINTSENPTIIWNYLNEELELDKHLNIDAKILRKIVKLIKRNKNAIFIPIENCCDCIDGLRPYEDCKSNLTYIDYHHSLVNREKDLDDFECNFYGEDNWVGYLLFKDMINKCTWIKAPNSRSCENNIIDDVDVMSLKNIDELPDHYSYIYFVYSPLYTPYKFRFIYDMIVDVFKEEIDE